MHTIPAKDYLVYINKHWQEMHVFVCLSVCTFFCLVCKRKPFITDVSPEVASSSDEIFCTRVKVLCGCPGTLLSLCIRCQITLCLVATI